SDFSADSVLYVPILLFSVIPRLPRSTLFPYTTLFRSDTSGNEVRDLWNVSLSMKNHNRWFNIHSITAYQYSNRFIKDGRWDFDRSEEHTSELQSRENLVCRPLLEKKNDKQHEQVVPQM